MTPREEFGAFLAFHRNRAGYSQAAVAEELEYTSPQFVSNFERGLSCPPLHTLPRLARLYRLSHRRVEKAWIAMKAREVVQYRIELRKMFREARAG